VRAVPVRSLLTRNQAAAALAAGALLAVAGFVRYGFGTYAIVGAILCPALTLLSAIDLRHRLLPDIIVLPAAVATGVVIAVGAPDHLVSHLIAGAVAAGILLCAALVQPGSMGMGDVKLALLIGVALGQRTIAAAAYLAVAIIVVALVLVVRRGRAGLKMKIAFGPLMALGAIAAFFTT
jgi:leader peptidase (prepilin peptidase)/N-methyltransferase